MPEIKLKHVCSVSTEDPKHPADNLLGQETYRKWQCGTAGEKQAVVVIQFEKASVIHSVDIGNNGSAFIEVLVGNSTGSGGDSTSDYEVLIVASSFMSPVESKSWSNINRVRMFGKDKLSKTVLEQKWDRVKLVCTQPFNKNEKYGISFVKFHSPPTAAKDEGDGATPTKKIGIFDLKSEPKVSGTLLFKKEPASVAAKARQASLELVAASTDDNDKASVTTVTGSVASSPPTRKRVSSKAGKDTTSPLPPKKAKGSEDGKVSEPVLFEELMKGVVFSLSGFKNPLRGELRDKALQMGAEYKPDWETDSTHLICAFSSTPKFNEVKSKNGLIVKKEWLLESYDKKRRLPASRYRFSTDSAEASFYDKKEKEIFSKISYTQTGKEEEGEEEKSSAAVPVEAPPISDRPQTPPTAIKSKEDPYGGSTDNESDMEMQEQPGSDECDTEDEIQRVANKRDEAKEGADDQISTKKKKAVSLLGLPDFFSGCVFFLYGDFSEDDTRLLTRYIRAYNGTIENYMSDKVSHVITQREWDENFDQAKSENGSLIFLEPGWIFACHKEQSLVSCEGFAILP